LWGTACGSEAVTAAKVTVSFGQDVQADQLRVEVLVGGVPFVTADIPKTASKQLPATTDFVVRFPDSSAGQQATFLVASLWQAAQTGRGDGGVTLVRGKTVELKVIVAPAACTRGEHSCLGTCYPDDDTEHCGLACIECASPGPHGTVACVAGLCTVTCEAGYTECEGACVNLTTDPDNCGHCGGVCGSGLVCSGGQCIQNPCPTGQHLCGRDCVSDTDIAHCGRECEPCPDPEHGTPTCNGISCGVVCDQGYHACGTDCLSNTSPNSCGSRCEPCPLPPGGHGTATCDGMTCGIACESGYHACSGDCVSNDDPAHCGSRCEPCPAPENGVAVCRNGTTCAFECKPGYKPCLDRCIPEEGVCQATWVKRSPSTSPSARTRPAMAYDAARHEVVLFGGFTGTSALDDTWTWNGNTWTQRFPAASPPARSAAAMAYDPVRQRIVLFGGESLSSFPPAREQLGDTWLWDGNNWTTVPVSQGPPARSFAQATWDPQRSRVLLFGGWNGNTPLNDLWAWNGTNWNRISTPSSEVPLERAGFGMISDPPRQHSLLIFGGSQDTMASSLLFDTWVLDGNSWSEVVTVESPSERTGHGLVFHEALGVGVLFGGLSGGGDYRNDTWIWDGSWTEIDALTPPSPRWRFGMAYDAGRRVVVLFGGAQPPSTYLAETWELSL